MSRGPATTSGGTDGYVNPGVSWLPTVGCSALSRRSDLGLAEYHGGVTGWLCPM